MLSLICNKKTITILEFVTEFPTEQSCRDHFLTQRESEGVICKKCSNEKQYWLKAKEQWQCASCSFR
ncbi:MAG: transposase, partial [Crocinitomix sp.]|nr:transposase [Crocinitomix sp.]